MTFKGTAFLITASLALHAGATAAFASPVAWNGLGLDQAQITGAGQTFNNLNGISGLTMTEVDPNNRTAC